MQNQIYYYLIVVASIYRKKWISSKMAYSIVTLVESIRGKRG